MVLPLRSVGLEGMRRSGRRRVATMIKAQWARAIGQQKQKSADNGNVSQGQGCLDLIGDVRMKD